MVARGPERTGPPAWFVSAGTRVAGCRVLVAADPDACEWRLIAGANRHAGTRTWVSAGQCRCVIQALAPGARLARRTDPAPAFGTGATVGPLPLALCPSAAGHRCHQYSRTRQHGHGPAPALQHSVARTDV